MRFHSTHWPDYDPIALLVLALGICATVVLAVNF